VHEIANHLFGFTIRVHDQVSARIGKLRTVPVADLSGRAILRQGTLPRPSRGGARVTNDSGVVRLARA
jgi:hypothetical protein